MIDLLKKTVLTGLGVASLTKEKIEEFGKDLTDKGKLTEQEGEKFVQEMLLRADESKESLRKQTELMVKTALEKMHLAKADDIAALQKEIEALRAEVALLRADSVNPKTD